MSDPIMTLAQQRGITRLCHFTPSRNLGHILTDPCGVLATQHLKNDERAVLNPTDLERLDGHPEYVCCSIQYPNAWYFRKARRKEQLFRDWVVLFIEPRHLWEEGTKFCRFNAAAGYGSHLRSGVDGFKDLFVHTIINTHGRSFQRGPNHPLCLPTDEQAEILVPDRIEEKDLLGIAVFNEAQAKRELAALRILNVRPPRVWIVPEFYNPYLLSNRLRSGTLPPEVEFIGVEDD